jgi:uncharacterized protein YjdB
MRVLLAGIGLALCIGACSADGTKSVQIPFDCITVGPEVKPASATLHPGDSVKGTASVSPCQYNVVPTFRWRSSNTSVAIVDSLAGLVRAVDTGRTSIIATLTQNRAVSGAMALTVVP